jgi:hypothetical protein
MKRSVEVLTVLSLGMSAPSAMAQEPEHAQKAERSDVHLRNDCRLAAQVLTLGQPANKREWALWRINDCDENGPPVLARMWREVAADSAALAQVVHTSVQLRDRRVYESLMSIVRDPSVPALKRAAALHVLGRWARPGFLLVYRQFFAPGYDPRPGRVPRVLFVDHDRQIDGVERLPYSVRADVARLAREIAASDPDVRLREAAKLLSRWLA